MKTIPLVVVAAVLATVAIGGFAASTMPAPEAAPATCMMGPGAQTCAAPAAGAGCKMEAGSCQPEAGKCKMEACKGEPRSCDQDKCPRDRGCRGEGQCRAGE